MERAVLRGRSQRRPSVRRAAGSRLGWGSVPRFLYHGRGVRRGCWCGSGCKARCGPPRDGMQYVAPPRRALRHGALVLRHRRALIHARRRRPGVQLRGLLRRSPVAERACLGCDRPGSRSRVARHDPLRERRGAPRFRPPGRPAAAAPGGVGPHPRGPGWRRAPPSAAAGFTHGIRFDGRPDSARRDFWAVDVRRCRLE